MKMIFAAKYHKAAEIKGHFMNVYSIMGVDLNISLG